MNETNIDFNTLSLYTTPVGRIVQQFITDMYLKKHERTSEYALYLQDLNDIMTSISQSFDDITLTIKLIRFAHPKIKSFKMTKADRGDYIKYHFENYFFRLPKLKDQVLQLLNKVFRMGLSQSQGLEKKVRAHPVVQNKKLYLFLDYFEEAFARIKPLRDTIAHRGDLADSDMTMLTSYQLAPYDNDVYEMRLRIMISKAEVFEKNQGILKQAVIILLLALEEEFNPILNSLSRLP
ncbi:Cthe_2314 family HEPN domain-containing protein [Mucilaginibacter sp. KACC 22773]|uniref:Cthe_2314 family HEPN domain-containing protein n=1 Tax=Mucilaginibacter sp. KACC 22773 TaxID=3025671 RepID=UPI0023650EF0|nr:Cthe_2314 family HEPN domain-containing protein [Mucilaginibacter sp. KACC 22773]WDF79049.1 Cthe_2314 family HEPN domain-containing protein [Mucilaginibacter sp. KACC 22773]